MRTRVVTYDVNTNGNNDYTDFYEYLETHTHKKLTESTYEIDSDLEFDPFADEIRKLFKKGDSVYIISVSDKHTLYSTKIR